MNFTQNARSATVAGMAEKTHLHPENVPGRFYVDDSCIDCDLCRSTAPNLFGRSDADGLSYVRRQPITADEIREAEEALADCPTSSIGEDGL